MQVTHGEFHRWRIQCNPDARSRPRVVDELKSRFDHFLKTGDDSKIPSDLTAITFRIVSDFVVRL